MAYKKIIGIVIADSEEYAPLEAYAKSVSGKCFSGFSHPMFSMDMDGVRVIGICAGIGKVNAAAAAMYLIAEGCNVIFNIGYAGGVSAVKRSDIIVGERFLEHDFDLTSIGYKFAEKPAQEYIYSANGRLVKALSHELNVKCGTVVTGDRFINDNLIRDKLKNLFDANACDMEAAAVAYAAVSCGIPFASVKIISDDAGDDALDSYREMNSNEGESLCSIALRCLKVIAATELV